MSIIDREGKRRERKWGKEGKGRVWEGSEMGKRRGWKEQGRERRTS